MKNHNKYEFNAFKFGIKSDLILKPNTNR